MISLKYVTTMTPFWQKFWILLKQLLLLLFWKTCLLQINLSHPQALSQAKPALPQSPLSIRGISSGERAPFTASHSDFRKSVLVAGNGLLLSVLGSGFILILVTHFLKEAGKN